MLPVDTPERGGGGGVGGGGGEDVGDIRTFKLKALMRQKFDDADQLSFASFTAGVKSRKALTNTFYHLLLLASAGQIRFDQPLSYGDIIIFKQLSF